jgi:hypothetical protein
MHDQIRITVVATGFDQAKQRLQQFVINQPQPQKPTPQPINISNFGHNNPPQSHQTPSPVKNTSDQKEENKEDDWDIPTFLRQRN